MRPHPQHITRGIHRALPTAAVRAVPLADGGEGFARALVAATRGTLHPVTVTGPVGEPVLAHYGILGDIDDNNSSSSNNNNDNNNDNNKSNNNNERTPTTQPTTKTAVIDIASAAGLALIPPHARDPTTTTTFGVGQLIAAALSAGAQRIIIGAGDSGTSDAGAGMLQALGARLLDAHGNDLPRACGGAALHALADVDVGGLDHRLGRIDYVLT
ncbi:putative glycerate kinase [Diplodia seriata]|uniref:Putative glycerate kinase n=1 Tax=Diplodia seriata TaxID=420778 RepID=A0A0G2DX06_9PEZI|nr:putative glycerate kinase [Diplodia seriata]